MFETRLADFAARNELDTSVVQELVQIFNEALIEIGQGILKDVPNKPNIIQNTKKIINKGEGQRWASKVAQSFAEEKELTLDDFPGIEKVTKQHMLKFLQQKNTQPTKQVVKGSPVNSVSKETTKRKVQCNGLNAKGDPCTRTGTCKPGDSKNYYCFRHADNWKDFETTVSSDSDSDDELELEEEETSKNEEEINSEPEVEE